MALVQNLKDEPDPEKFLRDVRNVIEGSRAYSLKHQKEDGSWHGWLYCDVTITCQYVFLMAWFEKDIKDKNEYFARHLLRQQRADGSWALTADMQGTVSPTVEAYLALTMLNVHHSRPEMIAAREFVLSRGGIGTCRIITRLWLATFGLLPWTALPFSPAELALLPLSMPFNIYTFAPWARALIVPYLMLMHYRPVLSLPNGLSKNILDELWPNPTNRSAPYGEPVSKLFSRGDWTALCLLLFDMIFSWLSGFFSPIGFIRNWALNRCMHWVLCHFEPTGEYPPGYPPGYVGLLAIHIAGIPVDDPRIQRGIAALDERHLVRKGDEMYIRTCTTPLWDTVLMCQALCDSSIPSVSASSRSIATERITEALAWSQKRQYLSYSADWNVNRPFINPGGFCIQYFDEWMVDIDDTTMAMMAFLKHDPNELNSNHVLSAAEYVVGMQSKNGGWAAFEADNTNFYLRKLPFCDHVYLMCDPPCPDVTGHALEVLGLMLTISLRASEEKKAAMCLSEERFARIQNACNRAIDYLALEMEVNGSWHGRWQCNFIFGTSTVLCGLGYFVDGPLANKKARSIVSEGIKFIKSWQNPDGGHGEATSSYFWTPSASDAETARPIRDSTISQTAWALMGLLSHLPASDEHIQRGIEFLVQSYQETLHKPQSSAISRNECRSVRTQLEEVVSGTWEEDFASGASIPGWMSLKYEYYPHYFPLMALGRYMKKLEAKKTR